MSSGPVDHDDVEETIDSDTWAGGWALLRFRGKGVGLSGA